MIKQHASDSVFGRRLKNWMNFLSTFHFMVMSTELSIMIGYWGIIRKDSFEIFYAGCTTEFKIWKDLAHAPQYLFLLIDCLFIREKLEYNAKFLVKQIYSSLVYLGWVSFLYLMFAIRVYIVLDWVSVGCYLFIGKMLVVNFFCGIVTIFIRKTVLKFLNPENKKD